MIEQFSRYDTADYLQTEEGMALYLEACMEENDPTLIAHQCWLSVVTSIWISCLIYCDI